MTDCIGKCIDKLSNEELYQITNNVHKTLTHPKGNKLFAMYLAQFPDRLACLNVYNTCSKYLDEERNQSIAGNSSEESLETLITKVEMIKETVDDMDEIDLSLMKQFKDALETKTKIALLTVLENTQAQCQRSLSGKIHERFVDHILQSKSTCT
ncbi:uncharacterized protein LOC105202601 [Solenopsis invicta]|uniref:uncharacterized protein LOC105202601 n=1 Tax=Solenopsis invicta TaxID=13686 RepID=UPI000595D881|nr:uncharacterized protein LOC105202601 [Solenopsis invicta]XP_039314752.1 uncharacterized protein LOC105202601 [Solenopsis invicta]